MRNALVLVTVLVLATIASAASRNNRQASCRQDRRSRLCSTDDSVFRLKDMVAGDLTWGGTNGVAGTTTRPSVATCPMPDGGITTLSANQPCITCLQSGVCGLYTEPSGTRLNSFPSGFDNAAWSKSGTATVTADATTAPDGTTTADLLSGVDGPANTTGSVVQNVTVTSGTVYTPSVWVKRVSTSGTLSIANNGASANGQLDCNLASIGSGWVRLKPGATGCTTVAAFTGTAGNVGGMVLRSTGGAISFYAWGAQVETNGTTLATTLIDPTNTAASATRAGVKHEFPTPAGLSRTEGCARVTLTPIWTGPHPITVGSSYFLNGNTANTARFAYSTSTDRNNVFIFDGTSSTSVSGGCTTNTAKTFVSKWSAAGNSLSIANVTDSATATPTTFTTLGAFGTNIEIGASNGNSQPIGAVVSGVTLGSSSQGCTR